MPTANQYLTESTTVRAFIYGHDKSLKTTWALNAAECGFRVLLLDFNKGASAVARLSPAARDRVYIVECRDGVTDAFASVFTTFLLKEYNCYVDEKAHRVSLRPMPGLQHIDMRNFGRDTVVVFDAYTDLVLSLARRYAVENKIDLSQAEKPDDLRGHYGWCGRMASWILEQIRAMQCHTIVIGHATQYEKHKKIYAPDGSVKDGPIEWSKRLPISTSNPHAMSITDKSDHVLQFYGEGRTYYIDARGSKDEAGGSRVIPAQRYEWKDMQFGHLCKLMGIEFPSTVSPFEFPVISATDMPIAKSVLSAAVITPAPKRASILL